ncbi:RNA polymerase sigma-70 factor [Mangrovibacterium lignilyticum]|uniref:RNA polymerase sigma-70 factor n=1 Tax=Mangrovibacterium lignilyticum TaxID=2668052 RepID=UPI0013D80F1B|nr:RNA polymerase sigma-70 factor [Mangrovibacterium lignilyticum]
MKAATDLELFSKLKQDDEKAFSELFNRYYSGLCLFAYGLLDDDQKTRELVQEVFVQLWEKRQQIWVHTSVKSYLFRAVKNQLINWINHKKVEQKYLDKLASDEKDSQVDQYFVEVDLHQKIEASIESLPPKRKEIFKLSREDELTYREIADRLGISVKTVETQMGLALKHLREDLKEYRHLLIGISLFRKYF